VRLNADVMPRLRVHDIYASALRQHKGEGSQALQQRLQEARWFIKNIQQRFDTILRVSNAIVERQKSFFIHGELAMRPLVLREIADELGLHESTISRVTTAKYMATPFGTFELKYFFGSGLGTETGGNASSTAVRALIKQFVASENPKKPLSDNQISDMLKEQGIECARRTVAKYRDALKIAPANLRKALVNQLQLFLPCAAGVEELLANEVHRLTGPAGPRPAHAPRRRAGAGVLARRDGAQPAWPPRPARAGAAFAHERTATSATCTKPPAPWPGKSGSPRNRPSRSRSRRSTVR
jgi:AraC-like DNA-binding protein